KGWKTFSIFHQRISTKPIKILKIEKTVELFFWMRSLQVYYLTWTVVKNSTLFNLILAPKMTVVPSTYRPLLFITIFILFHAFLWMYNAKPSPNRHKTHQNSKC